MGKTNSKNATLIVVDMQNDFITGSLANPDAGKIVDPICELIKGWKGNIIITRDTHNYDYLNTAEGKKLPIEHCIEGTAGWCLEDRIMRVVWDRTSSYIVNKRDAFSLDWFHGSAIPAMCVYDDIYIVGTCTDICVVSNALVLKSAYPSKNIVVYENLCAGTTPERHKAAIEVMKSCQIDIDLYKPEIETPKNTEGE